MESFAEMVERKRRELGLSTESVWLGKEGQPTLDIPVIPSGSLALDLALGVGGFPRGSIVQLAGAEGSGKTLLSLHTIREAQKLGLGCIFIDVERSFNTAWAEGFGVNPELLVVQTPESGKDLFEFLLGNKKGEPGVLKDEGCIGRIGVIVLDSLAMIIPPQEYEETDLTKQQVSPLARFLTAMLRKLVPAVDESQVCFIAINQLREKIGVLWGDPTTSPGGRAFKHACSVMVSLASLSGKDDIISDASKMRIGHRVRCSVIKNKSAPPYRQALFNITYRKGIDLIGEIVEYGVLFDIIKRSGAMYDLEGIDERIRGRDNLIALLREKPELCNALEKAIRETAANKTEEIESVSAESDIEADDLSDQEQTEDSIEGESF